MKHVRPTYEFHMRQKSCTDKEMSSNEYLKNSVQLNLITYSFLCLITYNVQSLYFHRGCARELDNRDCDCGGFGDQCRRFCVRARVFTQTASPFGGYPPAALTGTDSEFIDAIRVGITPTTPSVETFQWRICGTFGCQQAGLKCFF